jgi:hypothetical protein
MDDAMVILAMKMKADSIGELPFYSQIENLVLWAGSESIGSAVNICHGMLEWPTPPK